MAPKKEGKGFLAMMKGRDKMRNNYNNLPDNLKAQFRNTVKQGGPKAGKAWMANNNAQVRQQAPGMTGPTSQYMPNPEHDPTTIEGNIANQNQSYEQAREDNFNTMTPGSSTDVYGGTQTTTMNDDGTVSVNKQLGGYDQAQLDRERDLTENVYSAGAGMTRDAISNLQNNPYSMEGLQNIRGADDYEGERQRIEDSIYQRFERDNEPQFAQEMESFEQRMANRGVPMGSPSYDRERSRLQDNHNRQRENAKSAAIDKGGAAFAQQFGQDVQSRGIDRNEMDAVRASGLNEAQNVMGSIPNSQVHQVDAPAYQGTQLGPVNAAGISQGQQGLDIQRMQGESDNAYRQRVLKEQQRMNDASIANMNKAPAGSGYAPGFDPNTPEYYAPGGGAEQKAVSREHNAPTTYSITD